MGIDYMQVVREVEFRKNGLRMQKRQLAMTQQALLTQRMNLDTEKSQHTRYTKPTSFNQRVKQQEAEELKFTQNAKAFLDKEHNRWVSLNTDSKALAKENDLWALGILLWSALRHAAESATDGRYFDEAKFAKVYGTKKWKSATDAEAMQPYPVSNTVYLWTNDDGLFGRMHKHGTHWFFEASKQKMLLPTTQEDVICDSDALHVHSAWYIAKFLASPKAKERVKGMELLIQLPEPKPKENHLQSELATIPEESKEGSDSEDTLPVSQPMVETPVSKKALVRKHKAANQKNARQKDEDFGQELKKKVKKGGFN